MATVGLAAAALAGALLVVVLAIAIARRPTNQRLEALQAHPAAQVAPGGTLLWQTAIPAAGDRTAYLTRVWGNDEDPEALTRRIEAALRERGFAPTDEAPPPEDVARGRLLLHMRAGEMRYALVLEPLPVKVGPVMVTEGYRHVVRVIIEG